MRAVSLIILFAVTLAAGWLLYGTLHPAHAILFDRATAASGVATQR